MSTKSTEIVEIAAEKGYGTSDNIKTVGDLIRELKQYPLEARVLHSTDGEGNNYGGILNIVAGVFGQDDDPDYPDSTDERLTDNGVTNGTPYVILWSDR
jgi:hypothetical protein